MKIDKNTFARSVIGQAIGDAMGVPFEFKKRGTFKCTQMVGYGTWNKPAGTYSDDTAMLLCTIDAINAGYSKTKLIHNFIRWMNEGFCSVDNDTFDIGNTTSNALRAHIEGRPVNHGEYTNGNGSLMRMVPLAAWFMQYDEKERNKLIREISSVTHPHMISVNSCISAIDIAIGLLRGQPLHAAINNYDHLKALDEKDIKSDGFVVNTLNAALWVLVHTGSFEEAILKAVNLGGDTDTTAAVTGAFAGLMYDDIPEKWISVLRNKAFIDQKIEAM